MEEETDEDLLLSLLDFDQEGEEKEKEGEEGEEGEGEGEEGNRESNLQEEKKNGENEKILNSEIYKKMMEVGIPSDYAIGYTNRLLSLCVDSLELFKELTDEDLKTDLQIPLGHRLKIRQILSSSKDTGEKTKEQRIEKKTEQKEIKREEKVRRERERKRQEGGGRGKGMKKNYPPENDLKKLLRKTKGYSSHSSSSSSSSSPSPTPPPSIWKTEPKIDEIKSKEKNTEIVLRDRILAEKTVDEFLNGKKFLKIGNIDQNCHLDSAKGADRKEVEMKFSESWFTVGVLVKKSQPLHSSSGKKYMIWTLSSFEGKSREKQTEISLFLYSDVLDEFWKENCGLVLGVLSPRVSSSRSHGVSLIANGKYSLLKIGTSFYYGICQGEKRDGGKCSMYVHTKVSQYCHFHYQTKIDSLKSNRMALAGHAFSGTKRTMMTPPNQEFPTKRPKLSHIISPSKGPTLLQKAVEKLNSDPSKAVVKKGPGSGSFGLSRSQTIPTRSNAIDTLCSTLTKGSQGARNLRRIGGFETEKEKMENDVLGKKVLQRRIASSGGFLHPNMPLPKLPSHSSQELNKVPKLGRDAGSLISLNIYQEDPETRPLSKDEKRNEATKKKLEKALAEKNEILSSSALPATSSSISPTTVSNTSTNSPSTNSPLFNVLDLLKKGSPVQPTTTTQIRSKVTAKISTPPSKEKFVLSEEERKKLLNQKSQFNDSASQSEFQAELDKLENLIEKEERAEELQQTHEIDTNVVKCLTCGYMDQKPAKLCHSLKHELQHNIKVKKRFFKCVECGLRTHTYQRAYPKDPCRKCSTRQFLKVGMAKEKQEEKPYDIGMSDVFLSRGVEHGQFLSTRY